MPSVVNKISFLPLAIPFIGSQRQKKSITERLLRKLTAGLVSGGITFILFDGQKIEIESGHLGPKPTIELKSMKAIQRLVSSGYVGLAEGYIHGDWSTPSLSELFDFGAANIAPLDKRLTGNAFVQAANKMVKYVRRNNRSGSRKNISEHYDLGNDFFAEWLDPSMTYSSGIYTEGAREDLAMAQENKYRRIVEVLGIKSHHRVLEIGCGWGGFAEFAARETGAKITGITISQEQYDFAVARINNAGLQDQVNIVLQDYRDLQGQYDRIVSIEMLEAVGEEYWPTYFKTVSNCLTLNGEAMIQVITVPDHLFEGYKNSVDFIQRYIFPGGMLPCPVKMATHAADGGLQIADAFMFGRSYSTTLDAWQIAFQKHWPKITKFNFNQRFRRIWEYYLNYTSAGFRAGTIDVGQYHLKKP
jgi:cyclopropane-fatty-acyl-phospholipid synthase